MPLTRRRFLKLAAVAALSTALPAAEAPKSIVAAARREGLAGGSPDAAAADAVGAALCGAAGADSAKEAWARILRPEETVGIKVNCLAYRPAPVVAALVESLLSAGVAPGKIIVWDRLEGEMEEAGFAVQRDASRVRYLGTDSPGYGYDMRATLHRSVGTNFSSILSQHTGALVSACVLKDHNLAGVSLCLKNLYGCIANPNKFHDGGCNPYVADLADHPTVRSRMRLAVIDASWGQCERGPAPVPKWRWPAATVAASRDPVAVDAWGWRAIEGQRAARGLPSLEEAGRPPRYIETAAGMGLGEVAPERIRVLEV